MRFGQAIANRESFNINLRPETIAPDGVWHTKSAIDTVEATGEWDLRIYTYGNKKALYRFNSFGRFDSSLGNREMNRI